MFEDGKVLLVIQSRNDGQDEDVYFTDDLSVPQSDLELPASHGWSVDFFGVIEADLPGAFPIDYSLRKTF